MRAEQGLPSAWQCPAVCCRQGIWEMAGEGWWWSMGQLCQPWCTVREGKTRQRRQEGGCLGAGSISCSPMGAGKAAASVSRVGPCCHPSQAWALCCPLAQWLHPSDRIWQCLRLHPRSLCLWSHGRQRVEETKISVVLVSSAL